MTSRSFSAPCKTAIGIAVALALQSNPSQAHVGPPPVEFAGTQSGPGGTFDVLADGRIIGMNDHAIVLETAVGSGAFDIVGTLADGLISDFGAAFLSVNPAGTHAMVGDGNFGGASVLAFALGDLNGGLVTPDIHAHENFSAAWIDNDRLAITYANPATFSGEVGVLNRHTGLSTLLMTVGGASAGIGLTSQGTLLTGNGFDLLKGGTETGEVRAFSADRVAEVLNGQTGPIDFETQGAIVADLLSAGGLHLDARGDLFIGGGDFSGGDLDYFALLDAAAVLKAINGGGPVGGQDMFLDDPDTDPFSFYNARYNSATSQWLVWNGSTETLWRYRIIPAPGAAALLFVSLIAGTRRRTGNEVRS